MKTFKIVEDRYGIIERIKVYGGLEFETVNSFIEFCETYTGKLYGEGVHNILIAVESVSDNFKIKSSMKNGLTGKLRIGKTTLIDLTAWSLEIDETKASYEKVKQMEEKNKYVSCTPSAEVNTAFYKAMGYKEAQFRSRNTPSVLDAYLSSTKIYSIGFMTAYRGGILSSPADPNRIYENVVSYDISSAYPYSALTTLVPESESYTLNEEELKRLKVINGKLNIAEDFGFIGVFKVYGAKRKPWVKAPFLKRDDREFLENGYIDPLGVVSGDMTIAMCPADLDTLHLQYDYRRIEVINISIHRLGKIPVKAAEFIEEAYFNKSMKEKGSVEREQAKVALNTIVGFWGVDPFHSMKKIVIEDGIMVESYEGDLKEKFKNYSGEGKKIGQAAGLPRTWDFRWAVYTVAEVRNRIAKAEKALYDKGLEILYVDTDSIKVSGDVDTAVEVFEKLNKKVVAKYRKIGLGTWEDESNKFSKAVFRGVKVYFHEDIEGERHTKVSGIDKASAEQFNEMSFEKLADKETPIEVVIKRRSVAIIENDPFGAKAAYAIRELNIKY